MRRHSWSRIDRLRSVRFSMKRETLLAAVILPFVGCCLRPLKVANAPEPMAGPVRVRVLDEGALPGGRAVGVTVETVDDLVMDAVRAARSENPRQALDALVARVNAGRLEQAATRPFIGSIVAMEPTDLLFYP